MVANCSTLVQHTCYNYAFIIRCLYECCYIPGWCYDSLFTLRCYGLDTRSGATQYVMVSRIQPGQCKKVSLVFFLVIHKKLASFWSILLHLNKLRVNTNLTFSFPFFLFLLLGQRSSKKDPNSFLWKN